LDRRVGCRSWPRGLLGEAIAQRLRRQEIRIERESGFDFAERVLLVAGVRERAGGSEVRLKSLPPFAVSHDGQIARPVPIDVDLNGSPFDRGPTWLRPPRRQRRRRTRDRVWQEPAAESRWKRGDQLYVCDALFAGQVIEARAIAERRFSLRDSESRARVMAKIFE
jgi:hypothetical protein